MRKNHLLIQVAAQCLLLVLLSDVAFAQTVGGIDKGATALTALTSELKKYISPVTTVVYIVAAVVGIVGALRVYVNWQNGKENVMASATGWLGACLFLLIANAVLVAMFV